MSLAQYAYVAGLLALALAVALRYRWHKKRIVDDPDYAPFAELVEEIGFYGYWIVGVNAGVVTLVAVFNSLA